MYIYIYIYISAYVLEASKPSEMQRLDAGPACEDFGKGLMMPVTALIEFPSR